MNEQQPFFKSIFKLILSFPDGKPVCEVELNKSLVTGIKMLDDQATLKLLPGSKLVAIERDFPVFKNAGKYRMMNLVVSEIECKGTIPPRYFTEPTLH